MFKKILLVILLSCTLPTIVLANRVAAIPVAIEEIQVSGRVREPKKLDLYPGEGITLNYSNLDEKVDLAWADNPSIVGVDINKDRDLLHLKAIEAAPINNIERIKRTLLTVVTTDKSGRKIVYLYQVEPSLYASYSSGTGLINYMPAVTNYDRQRILTNLRQGVKLNIFGDTMKTKVIRAIKAIESGTSVKDAANEAGLGTRFLDNLNNF